jgi:catechol 2,3-dioxygenase
MLPHNTRLGPVHLQVADLDRSVGYYERVLGLRASVQSSGAVSLGVGDNEPSLVHLHGGAHLKAARRGAFGLYHFAILLPDRGALGRFAGHLGRLGVRAGAADHRVSEAFYLYDPDGLGIEVYADRPRSTWQYRGGELVMTTDPLDVEDLAAAAGGHQWDRAPNGTTMGHVHLAVGDLREAERFYSGALGFDKTVWSYPGALFFSAGGHHHHLAANTWSAGPGAAADEARLLAWELQLPDRQDLEATIRRMTNAGYAVAENQAGDRRVVDPWGVTVAIQLAPSLN